MSGTPEEDGRVNQKRRTRTAIIAACQELITAGADINMPAVARAALVSEPTAYRYFPDLASLLEEALAGIEPDPAAALAAGADPGDPVERVAYAAELLAKLVIERQGAIRALMSVSIARGTARQCGRATASPSSIRRWLRSPGATRHRRGNTRAAAARPRRRHQRRGRPHPHRPLRPRLRSGGGEHRAHRASHHRGDAQPHLARAPSWHQIQLVTGASLRWKESGRRTRLPLSVSPVRS